MMYSFHSHIQTVNYLKEICRKRKEGYTKAAEYIKKPEIEKLFVKYAKQSDDFEYELLHYSDQPSADSEAFDEYQPNGWQNLDDKLEDLSLENILELCEKNEKSTIGDFEEALEEELPEEIESLLNRQLIEITDAYDTIMNLRKQRT